MCTSTTHEGCKTPYVYLTQIWESHWMGIQPQSSHYIVVLPSEGNQITRNLLKTRPYPHPQQMKVSKYHYHWIDNGVGAILVGSFASTTALHRIVSPHSLKKPTTYLVLSNFYGKRSHEVFAILIFSPMLLFIVPHTIQVFWYMIFLG